MDNSNQQYQAPVQTDGPAPVQTQQIPVQQQYQQAPVQHQQHAPAQQQTLKQEDMDIWSKRLNDALGQGSAGLQSRSPETSQTWYAGIFDCFNPIDTCLVAYCCPCVTFGKTFHRMENNGNMEGYQPVNTSCLLLCGTACFGLAWVPLWLQRSIVRTKYNLSGSCLEDLLLTCCCHCCSLIQQDKEAEHHEANRATAGVQQQYAAPQQMAYPPKQG